jgi:tyrosinase
MLNDVIPKYDEATQATLKEEAAKFRFPYWDWAAKKPRADPETGVISMIYDLPLIVQQEKVQVSSPDGEITTIPNPLWCFRVSPDASMGEYGITPVQMSDDGEPYEAIPVCPHFSCEVLFPFVYFLFRLIECSPLADVPQTLIRLM